MQRLEQTIARLTSFLSGPGVCPQLGNKFCPHSKESHIGDSFVFDTFLHSLIVHSGSLQRAFDEAHLWCLASKDKNKVANDCQTWYTSEKASISEGVGQVVKKGKVPKCQHSVT